MRGWKWLLASGLLVLIASGVVYFMAYRQFDRTIHATLPVQVTDSDLAKAKLAIQGVKGQDLRNQDFSRADPSKLNDLTYDTQTRWPGPDKLPSGFDPGRTLAWAKDPGLGLRALQAQGIDGRGVSVAIFDKPIRQSHQEFAGRIRYIEVFPNDPKNKTYHFHGAAVASILAGKTVGVAPGAMLYYFAVPDNGQNLANYAVAMEQLLALNATLPPADRIRVVSISDGFNQSMLERPDVIRWADMIHKAEQQGIAVIHCSYTFQIQFNLTGVRAEQDRNNPDNYFGIGYGLLVPAHTRTTAGNESDSAYTYWGTGGASWAAPYLAGMAALGLQVNPTATPAQLYAAMINTATTNRDGLTIVNPTGFLQALNR